MKNYNEIKKVCEKNSRISTKLVDEFLLGYAARHRGLENKMNQEFARYRHVTEKFDKGAVNMMKSQYIAHRIFREGGLIGKLLKNPALKRFGGGRSGLFRTACNYALAFQFQRNYRRAGS